MLDVVNNVFNLLLEFRVRSNFFWIQKDRKLAKKLFLMGHLVNLQLIRPIQQVLQIRGSFNVLQLFGGEELDKFLIHHYNPNYKYKSWIAHSLIRLKNKSTAWAWKRLLQSYFDYQWYGQNHQEEHSPLFIFILMIISDSRNFFYISLDYAIKRIYICKINLEASNSKILSTGIFFLA